MRQDVDRPYVLINIAATADGKIDTVERRGAAISSEQDRARVDALRASVDAVMVGGRTLHDEDPRLTVKSAELRAERAPGADFDEWAGRWRAALEHDLIGLVRAGRTGEARTLLRAALTHEEYKEAVA